MIYQQVIKSLKTSALLSELYQDTKQAIQRYHALVQKHKILFDTQDSLQLVCAPGRSELIGNHTDHNHGIVLASAVNMDIAAAVSPRNDLLVHLHSEGYSPIALDLADLNPNIQEPGTSAALVRGVASGMKKKGFKISGFDAVMSSQVLSGSGLSSSAAFEILIAFIIESLFNNEKLDPIVRAQIGQYAENVFFLKPSGLMDQMASSFGGLISIDFEKTIPEVELHHYSFSNKGYALTIVATDSSHDNLTDAYSAIPKEMKEVSAFFSGQVLRNIEKKEFYANLGEIRRHVGDRAIQRAMHFYQENERVIKAISALKTDNLPLFFQQINASGISSWTLLQNISVDDRVQPMALALATAQSILGDRGACRVHGGGFAGTTLNFVPMELLPIFTKTMESLFGSKCYHILDVRQHGPVRIV